MRMGTNGTHKGPIPTTHDREVQALACSMIRDSRVREIEKARTRKQNGRKLGRERAKITCSYFRLPFTRASSPLSESLEQATQVIL